MELGFYEMSNERVFKYAERKANKFNIIGLLIIAFLGIVVLVLNEFDVFTLDKVSMRATLGQLLVYDSLPLIIYLIHDKALKKETILEKDYFKKIIIAITFVSVLELCVPFSFHGTILFAIPPIIAAQYKSSKKFSLIILLSSMLLVIVATYGSFIFGMYDANLLKPLSQEEAAIISNRVNLLTFKRIVEVFYHYALPNMIGLAAIDFIALTITRRTSDMLSIEIDLNIKVQDEIVAKANMQNGVIEHLADIIESRDIETGEHIKRTKKYVSILVEKMKTMDRYKDYLTPKMCEYIINAAPLHDIGKIAVSDLILCKPGKLTDDEFEKMKIHTVKGGEIIKNILNELGDKEFLEIAYEVAISHHEKWNGRGYPYGIKEEEIPLPGRIMAVADVFDALVAKRVYKDPMPIDKAINIIIGDSGTHFDPGIVEVFQEVEDEFTYAATAKL